MKALRKLERGQGHVELVEVEVPRPEEGEVLVKVKYCGVCGTDIHILHDEFPKAVPPVTLGHEFSGVIHTLGAGVEDRRVGDRVTVNSAAEFCRTCEHCRAGLTQRCDARQGFGSGKDGAFADFVVARWDGLHALPDHVTFQEGAFCEPLSCATHAVMERSAVQSGDIVLITGPGTIGLLVLQTAKAVGAKAIMVGTEKDEERLEVAADLGADRRVRTDRQDPEQVVEEFTKGRGVDSVFECSGAERAVNDSLHWVRKGGEFIQVGLFGRPIAVDYDQVVFREIQVKGSFTHNRGSWEKALALLRDRKVDMRPLISGEYPLDRWQEAFEKFENGVGLKYLLHPMG
jgi:L-iditol 2-dehydrogenase